ncbi:hypothetical protein ERO13_A13G024600v2 [Gossypium hirsutum]|uniref:Uncharacterized protein isoform X2 n=1 Tax=Gossypium hirsutum TaxID=3635 RepID=A0A1U8K4V9_GOSHI|nr:uncharacterized protein LOC107913477 isoform X2 [Gossypium hirsutum]XP_040940405.1 uncharacterized protein LOC107913477 isoform X2 [Gossypium hirsutum]KAG4164558.1 hypothetical protein ERO13_A13G024600v2 [Gossypium hirsutum]KAG4164559.1 hypothetical protein ERO13_A13G024600v2 [Gossypium hirsutum]
MPQEPLPWDRKDIYKDRKHERAELQPPPLSAARWREASSMSSYQHGSFREFARWGSADFRRPPGHGKQGNWHLFPEDIGGHGYVPWRSSDKILDGETYRQSVSRGDGKYGRSYSRDNNRGSYNQRDWRGHSLETSNGSPNTSVRPHDVNNEQRSVDDMFTYPSRTHSDFVNTWNQLQKDQHDNRTCGVNGLGTGQRCERENSLGSVDWKPLKWSRSGSLSSWGSGFSHSSSSKSLGGVDSGEAKLELHQKNLAPVQSPSGDAAACVTSAPPSDETTSRKKPRLGWGEGLAKFEKKKDEGPDTSINSGGAAISLCNTEPNTSLNSNLVDKSPRVLGFSDCSSPATPSSVACSSSPGVEEKSFGKAANIDNDVNNLCGSPSFGSQNQLEGSSFSLEKLDINSIINMGSSLIDLLQSDEPSTMDSSFVQSTAINKLLLWKGDILKALEMTESEIDSLETELKSSKDDPGRRCQCPATSSSFPVQENGKSCEEQEAASSMIPQPASLKIDPSNDVLEVLQEANADIKDGVIDSPGTATSDFMVSSSLEKAESLCDVVKVQDCSGNSSSAQLTTMEQVILATDSCNEEAAAVVSGEGSVLVKIDNEAHVPESSNSDAAGENMTCDVILTTNKELANRASLVFKKLLPKDQYSIEISEISNAVWGQISSLIREKIAMRKRHLRFKERVLTLKFKAFQYAWKEDMLSPAMRKYWAKSQKKYELSLRSTYGGYQKHRSSYRSRVTSSGNLVLEPTAEMINFTSKLLLDSHVKLYRNALKMPALILDEQEQLSRFISSNGLVEDPCAIEKERALINPWTSEEKEIFMDKLAAFGKDFRKIATFLDHKTTADCVEFYYKNHKSECFKKTKKKLDLTKQGKSSANTYLLTSGKKWSKEFNAASIDVLGAASVIATHAESGMQKHQTSSSRIFFGGHYSKISRADDRIANRSSSFDIIGNDRETTAADVLAGICGSLSSEAMSSCITSSVDPGESFHRDWKCHKVDSLFKRRSTSNVAQNVDDGTCSDESCGEMDPADWTDEEKSVFIQAVSSYGKDFAMISRCVRTRSRDQCKVFFSKARKCLGLDLIDPRTRNLGTPMSDDANGGGSDTENACVLECLVVSSDKLGSKPEDLPSNIVCTNMDERNPTSKIILPTDLNVPDENDRKLVDHRDSEAVQTVDSDAGRAELITECSVDMNIDSKAGSLQVQKSVVALGNLNAGRDVTEQGVSVAVSAFLGAAAYPCIPSLDSVAESKPATSLYEHDTKCSAETSSQSICRMDSNKATDESVGKNSCSSFSLSAKGLHQIPPDLDSAKKPSVSNNSSANGSALHDSDALRCEKICNLDRLSSTLDYEENETKQAQKSVREDESGRLSGKTSVNITEPRQILRGYPLQVSTLKEMNGDVKGLATSKTGSAGPCLAQECYLQKCNSSKSAAELPLLVENLEQAKDRLKSHSRISDTENPGRNGNVKLFGQILNSSSRDDKVSHFSKQNTKPSNLKLIGNNVDGNSKFDANNHVAENVPKRSYGFWDGKRIQTGLSSLPDSSILMAKYPSAFANYPPTSSSQMEQQALQTVVHSTDRTLNGVSFPLKGNKQQQR